MCMWFYWNLKWPPQINFLNICDRKKSNLIYGGGWYRTSVLLLIFILQIFCFCRNMWRPLAHLYHRSPPPPHAVFWLLRQHGAKDLIHADKHSTLHSTFLPKVKKIVIAITWKIIIGSPIFLCEGTQEYGDHLISFPPIIKVAATWWLHLFLTNFLVCRLDTLLSWFSTQTSVVNFRYYLFCLCNVRRQYLLPGILGIYCFLTGVPSLPAVALPKGRICSLVNQVYTSFPLMSPPFVLHWPNVG